MNDLLRIYSPDECGPDGYPMAWHHMTFRNDVPLPADWEARYFPIKDVIREEAGHRCIRCGHPYPPGIAETCPRGEWTPCDERCTHGEPTRVPPGLIGDTSAAAERIAQGLRISEAQWRILTVHHLNGVKYDCRWWNLTALCQRCHLTIQGKVVLDRDFAYEHSEWFKPYAAAWYAVKYLDEELTRETTMARLDELLALEQTHYPIPGLDAVH